MVLKSPDIKCLNKSCCNPALEVSPTLPIDNRSICKDGDVTKIRIGPNGPIYVPNEKAIIEIPSYPDIGDLGDRMTAAEGAIEAIEDEIGDESSPGTILAKIADNTAGIEALEDEVGAVGEAGTIRDDIDNSVKNVSIADQITSSSFVRLITVEKNSGASATSFSSVQLYHTPASDDSAKREGMSRYGIAQSLAGKQDVGNYATQTDLAQGLATRQPICSIAQQNALDSGITAGKVATYDGYDARLDITRVGPISLWSGSATSGVVVFVLPTGVALRDFKKLRLAIERSGTATIGFLDIYISPNDQQYGWNGSYVYEYASGTISDNFFIGIRPNSETSLTIVNNQNCILKNVYGIYT